MIFHWNRTLKICLYKNSCLLLKRNKNSKVFKKKILLKNDFEFSTMNFMTVVILKNFEMKKFNSMSPKY